LQNRAAMRGLALFTLLAGCTTAPAPAPAESEAAATLRAAAERNGVPRDLMAAIAGVEGGLLLPHVRILRLDDDVPVGGALELRHGAFNSLGRGAQLVGSDETTLRIDTDLATEAGARVLAELGPRDDDRLEDWRDAVEELSGYSDARARGDYSRRVYQLLHDGATLAARDGEAVLLPAHPSVAVERASGELQEAASDTPDFPGAIWFTTDCTNKCTAGRPDGNASVNTIVIHDTEGGWDASVATLQNDSGKSVHYIVDADGSRVGQFRHETDTTWHAGNWEYNKHSVGIEHVGFVSNASGYARAEYDQSVALVKSIRTRWTVPLDRTHIVGHYQIPDGDHIAESSPPCGDQLDVCENSANYGGASNHRDPGEHWDWCQYMESLGGTCDCADAWSLWNCTNDHTEAVRCVNDAVEIAHCEGACQSMPVGSDDVCPQASAAPSADPAPSTDPSTDPSTVPDPSSPPSGPHRLVVPHFHSSGCAVDGAPGDGALVWILLALSAAARPARRRAARAFAESRARRRSAAR
jgi:N-acetyl-anhydromuramyl-L-alanine amidase AmpD